MTFMNDLRCILLVLGLAGECKRILALSIGDLVDSLWSKVREDVVCEMRYKPEPLVGSPDEARKVTFDILDIVELRSKWVDNINNDNFPVSLALIEQGHDTKHFDLFDLSSVTSLFANLTDVERVIVAICIGLCVLV